MLVIVAAVVVGVGMTNGHFNTILYEGVSELTDILALNIELDMGAIAGHILCDICTIFRGKCNCRIVELP